MREWAYEDFGEFLDARMNHQGIRNDAELSRLSGVKQTQISNWRRNLARPTPESLDKIAAVLKVPSVILYQLAGHLPENDPVERDYDDTPPELRNLVDLYRSDRLTDGDRAFLLRSATALVSHLVADLDRRDREAEPPVKRPRRGRSAA